MVRRADSWTAFFWWAVAGLGLCSGVLSILTVGPFVLLVTLALCGLLLYRLDVGWGMLGLLLGAAVPLLYVAWLNRDGPGTVCSTNGLVTSCGDEASPWPFVAMALLVAVIGVVSFVRLHRQ
jgi:hypothetical protein